MTDPQKERDGGQIKNPGSTREQTARPQHSSKTEGTDRDFDESGESQNQGHGHPREERGNG